MESGGAMDTVDEDDQPDDQPRPPAAFIRYVSNAHGTTMYVPKEWVDAPVGEIFKNTVRPLQVETGRPRRMVEEIS